MKFEIEAPWQRSYVILKPYIDTGSFRDAVIRLNLIYKGWVYVANSEDPRLNQIYFADNYHGDGDIKLHCSQFSTDDVTLRKIENLEEIKIQDYMSDDVELYAEDIVYKLRKIGDEIEDEPEDIPEVKTRWWNKGKFESMKTFESFNEGIKWYSKGKFEPVEEIETVVYDDFITDDEFRQFLIDNNCYDEYLENCGEDVKRDFDANGRGAYISNGFGWNGKGKKLSGNFWADLDEKWMRLIK